jgi:hypothetical protein
MLNERGNGAIAAHHAAFGSSLVSTAVITNAAYQITSH